ncbi:MAG: polysaccharide biosynthesis protein [Eubacteriales bacterium]|nr:polysaccharide biosynthesis protein [Eubacteriales bacterium]MDD4390044.1 polysaccharide biosynthesis protein [Eubacteriales bacterium]
MGKKSFLRGAAVLGIAGLLTQVLGAVFRIPLGNIIGTDGMAYYQTAYPVYIFLLVFSTNGAPAAISKMTSERIALGRYAEAHKVFKLSFVFMSIFGLICFATLFFGAEAIVNAMGNAEAYYSVVAIAPALLLVPIMSVFRGYFQGMQQMEPTAVSQITEQSIRVFAGLSLAVILMPMGIEFAAAGASFGGSIGPIFGVAAIIIIYLLRKKKIVANIESDKSTGIESAGSILKTLAIIAIPITIGVSIQPIMNLGDAIFVMNRLQDAAGFGYEGAKNLYGALTGFAAPVINIPMALALSMALSLVPAIASAKSGGDTEALKTNVNLGLRTSMIIGVPCSFGLMIIAEPIMLLLFPLQTDGAVTSSSCLFYLAAGTIFLCIAQTMAGILQGLDKLSAAVWGIVAGFVVKCVLTYFLTGIPGLNVKGAAIATSAGYLTIAMINFLAVKQYTGIKFNFNLSVVKPIACGIAMSVIVLAVYKPVAIIAGNSLAVLISVAIGACVYGICLIKIKAITSSEIKTLPKGEKLLGLLKKVKLV